MLRGVPKGKTKLSNEELKAKKREYNQRPEVKARRRKRDSRPEVKARRRKRDSRPEVKAMAKKIRDLPKNKSKLKKIRDLPKNKAKAKKRLKQWREENKEHIAKYVKKNKEKIVTYSKKWRNNPENKLRIKKLNSSPKYLEKQKEHRVNLQMKVFLNYSKRYSNSDIPCCRCCGQTHIEFLSVDHIAGKKQMDSEPELVKLGYSSKFHSVMLKRWIIKNNFPEGFQILCHNCNLAKGFSKDNKCSLEGKPH
jgi:hypothetical protein